jgi:hypothetical protein
MHQQPPHAPRSPNSVTKSFHSFVVNGLNANFKDISLSLTHVTCWDEAQWFNPHSYCFCFCHNYQIPINNSLCEPQKSTSWPNGALNIIYGMLAQWNSAERIYSSGVSRKENGDKEKA